jgi:hypothetical protein
MMHGQVEVIHNPFDDPPEAVAEEAPAATVYMRVPATLKDALEKAAKSDGVSVNAWMMRCAGSCLKIRGGTATNVVQPDAIAPIVRGRGKRKRTRGQGAPSSG